jgi:hypothetical protein
MFDLATGDLVRTFRSPDQSPGLSFGAEIAVTETSVVVTAPNFAGGFAPVHVFDRDTGDLRYTLDATQGDLGSFGFLRFGIDDVDAADGRILVTSKLDEFSDVAYLFDEQTGQLITDVSPGVVAAAPADVDYRLENGLILAYGPTEQPTVDVSLFVYDSETGQQRTVIENQGENAPGLAVRPDGSILAVGSSQGVGEVGDTLLTYRPVSEIAGGSNVLIGGDGDDFLVSGLGADRMTGAEGQDTFMFDPGWGADVVTDFSVEDQDHLVFRGIAGLDAIETGVRDGSLVLTYGESEIVLVGVGSPDLPHNIEFIV